ncbi:uroporphyrinogen-III synthase [Piscinibacter terrae]|uniref:Uroporphyrinogen-III synthase n=1 Tax=Piscinibacter terrae TaxID=2496871 RepID=A0A3N7HW43_9BURK|nr:uroporphyrinogen-III synthase [Albitalea terrae]RQP25211.1 uroporphyrinogen-III synthase [Albitalea terrae]
MRIIVTRPAAQAAVWVDKLQARGLDAVAMPLIGIQPAADREAVLDAWRGLPSRHLVVFVSPNAVEEFFACRPAGAPWPEQALAGSVGPGSTQALQSHGVPAASIAEPRDDAPQFDSEALWAQLAHRPWDGRSVLVVRGDGGREWLADTLKAHGAQVDFVAAYRRVPTVPDDALLAQAIESPSSHLWFFSSSEAVANLREARPALDWARSCAIATHPRIAQRARDCGFGVVHECPPTLDGVVACIQSLAS